MSAILDWFSGKKTYLFALAMVIVGGLYQQGYIGDTWFKTLEVVFGGGGLAAARAAIAKVGQ